MTIDTPYGLKARLVAPPGVKIIHLENFASRFKACVYPKIMEYRPHPFPQIFLSSSSAATLRDVAADISAIETNLTGSNVTVGIVDTGIDFSTPGLNLSYVARSKDGTPLLFDADELGLAITPLNVTANPYTDMLNTSGSRIKVYIPGEGMALVRVDYDWRAPPINSSSGVYHFGFLIEYYFPSNLILGGSAPGIAFLIPVVLVDSRTPGVYDTVFADISSTWFTISGIYYALGLLTSPPSQKLLDFSFHDETPLRMGEGVGYIDSDGDNIPDFSIGVVSGYVYDAYNIIAENKAVNSTRSYSWETGWEPLGSGIFPGIDKNGRYVDIFYDPIGHGTTVAYIIAGRRASFFLPTVNGFIKVEEKGLSPDVRISAAMSIMNGNVLASLYWMSGHDYRNGTWIYTGRHKSDIISNSWGVIYWQDLLLIDGNGFVPGGDPLSYHLSKIADHSIVVFAAGNEGPALESVAIGGASYPVITVGASTVSSGPLYDVYGHLLLPSMVGDNVISWSSRGPNALGRMKPDLVAPGAYALAPTAVMNGLGDGSRAVDIFGGTSMATPVVAGSIAQILQFMKEKGEDYNTSFIKSLLQVGSDDLGLPPTIQGYGKINVSKTILLLSKNISITIPSELNAYLEDNGEITVYYPSKQKMELYKSTILDAKNITVAGFSRKPLFIPLSSTGNYSFLEVTIVSKGNLTEIPFSMVLLGGWRDENNDSKIQLNELIIADQAVSEGRITSLYLSRESLEGILKKGGLTNNSLIIYFSNLDENGLEASVIVRGYYPVYLKPIVHTGLLRYKLNQSIQQYILDSGYLIDGKTKNAIVLERVANLGYKDKNLTLPLPKATHAGFFGGLGDTYTVRLEHRIQSETGVQTRGHLLGFVVTTDNRGVDFYLTHSDEKYLHLAHIDMASASHPPGFLPSGRGYFPLPKPAPPSIFIPLYLVNSGSLLHVYVIDSNYSTVSLKFYPVFYRILVGGSTAFIQIYSNYTLGEIFLPGGRVLVHHKGWVVGNLDAYNETIVLKDFYSIALFSLQDNGFRTVSYIGKIGISVNVAFKGVREKMFFIPS